MDKETGEVKASWENGFCMNSYCINYFEDNCMLCYSEDNKEKLIYPYNIKFSLWGSTLICKEFIKRIYKRNKYEMQQM